MKYKKLMMPLIFATALFAVINIIIAVYSKNVSAALGWSVVVLGQIQLFNIYR